MKRIAWLTAMALLAGCAAEDAPKAVTQSDGPLVETATAKMVAEDAGYVFQKPVALQVGDEPIQVEAPGYACPTVVDLDADGDQDLVVGQFSGGKMHYFENVAATGEAPKFTKAAWIMDGDEPASVPGVW